jgi:hypothetical protein
MTVRATGEQNGGGVCAVGSQRKDMLCSDGEGRRAGVYEPAETELRTANKRRCHPERSPVKDLHLRVPAAVCQESECAS